LFYFNLISNLDLFNSPSKSLVLTLNAHSYRLMQIDKSFKASIEKATHVIPDGISIVHLFKATGIVINKISGTDLFLFEMNVFFLGSSDSVLQSIQQKASYGYPNVHIASYSPPFTSSFSKQDNDIIVEKINVFKPDVLFIGMTAPKQEKWAHEHFDRLEVGHVCCIGAVFDFYAGTVKRPPQWMINLGLEWLGRLLKEPKRMWYRYLISSPVIYIDIIKYKVKRLFNSNTTKPIL